MYMHAPVFDRSGLIMRDTKNTCLMQAILGLKYSPDFDPCGVTFVTFKLYKSWIYLTRPIW